MIFAEMIFNRIILKSIKNGSYPIMKMLLMILKGSWKICMALKNVKAIDR